MSMPRAAVASWEVIAAHAVQITPEDELVERLKQFESGGRPLRIKMGADPSAPDLHIGHAVGLRKLRQFQDLGHQVVLIIGDATARIGDPSGKSIARPQLTRDQVDANARTYMDQAFIILDREKTEVRYNSEWLDAMDMSDLLRLMSNYTVARMLERDDFRGRYQGETPIYIHEFLYPLMQAYDSVAIDADVEIGGTDQTFNLLVGREIQDRYGKRPQCILTLPLLVGTDGVKKMSKSLGNYIGLTDAPGDMFGKVMSISDELMETYMRLAAWRSEADIAETRAGLEAGSLHPRDVKAALAAEVVTLYHSAAAARQATEEFDRIFRTGGRPDDMETRQIAADSPEGATIGRILTETGLAASNRAARQLIAGGGVQIDDVRIEDPRAIIGPGEHVLQKGSRTFLRLIVA